MKPKTTLYVFFLLAVVVLCAAPFVGMSGMPWEKLWDKIILPYRLPRAVIGFLAGAGLATAGMTFQAMFRNPLATPFTLGVSSGAALGASVAIYCGARLEWLIIRLNLLPESQTASMYIARLGLQTVLAFVGAVGTIGLIYLITRIKRDMSTATMLLAGVALSYFFSSIILIFQYLGSYGEAFQMLRWVMGGLSGVSWPDDVFILGPFVLLASVVVWWFMHDLNLLTTGESLAASRGVNVERVKRWLFFVVSLMVGAVVAVCGPIGFVGLMSPHICRMIIGPDHRYLMPASWLFGGTFLVVCDTVARTAMAPTEFPVGIITALLGGPFFIWLLLRK
ncbi:MAG: iron ABC transporter permease [Planctomycetia bacterium]|jgi:iron complex transport system permease protein